jgi:acyl-CoA hydrolase
MIQAVTPEEAVKVVRSGDRVFIHSAAATPGPLVSALVARAPELRDVEIVHLHTEGDAPYARPEMEGSFRVSSLFIGANVRRATQEGRADYIPIFLSEVPQLFRRGVLEVNVALVQVSPPDRHGFCSLGVSVDTTRAVVETAKFVVAMINPRMPRTHGDGLIRVDRFHAFVECDVPLPEVKLPPPDDVQKAIGKHVAGLIEDGSTLQMGIGAIPDAVLSCLTGHQDLGVHTEMFSDGLIDLVEKGVVNGRQKKKHPRVIVAGFVVGSRRLYDFVDDNPQVRMLDIAYVNDPATIARNPRVVAINSALEVDLTGQVVADSIGCRLYSGVGGQMDFIRGASLSEGGKPIIALPSRTSRGESRIVPFLKKGAGVVTTRAHVHYVATEYGIVNLFGRTIRQRAEALAGIAHPDDRERILRELRDGIRSGGG